MHVEKFTASSVHQMFYHVERMRGGHYSNESIDTSKRPRTTPSMLSKGRTHTRTTKPVSSH